jgi:cyclopropane fatty-acyl-phospholipid synthase-like methyltransferase
MHEQNPTFKPEDLRAYYEANTHAFVKFGEGGQSIHRAVWAPGVVDKDGAFHHVDAQILKQLVLPGDGSRARVLDLGCGVGASLLWLARHADIDGVGVTISPLQAGWARKQAIEQGLGARVQFLEASFTALPSTFGEFDLAFSIEAFVLSPSPQAFLAEVSRHLKPGGKLVLVDDFLTEAGAQATSGRGARWIREFRRGWMASSVITVAQLQAEAGTHGLHMTASDDLTPYLELRRPRDLAISALVSVGRYLPIRNHRWLSWLGGNGLQMGLVHGFIEHRIIVLERR